MVAEAQQAETSSELESLRSRVQDMERRSTLVRAEDCIRRLCSSQLGAAFSTWRQNAECMRRLEVAARRVSVRLVNLSTSRAFDSWCAFVQRRSSCRALMGRLLAGSLARELRGAWARWQLCVRAGRASEHRGEMLALEAVMAGERRQVVLQRARKALLRSLHGAVGGAWVAWCQHVEYMRRVAEVMRRAGSRLRLGRAARCFAGWCGFVARRRRLRVTVISKWRRLVKINVTAVRAEASMKSMHREALVRRACILMMHAAHSRLWSG